MWFRLAPDFVADYWYIVLVFGGSLALVWWATMSRLGGLSGAPTRSWIWRALAGGPSPWWACSCWAVVVCGTSRSASSMPALCFTRLVPGGTDTPFTIMTSLGKPVVLHGATCHPSKADALWPVVHTYQDDLYTVAERPNVVASCWSFSAEYSSQLTGGTGYMPFLDSLMRSGLCATKAYAKRPSETLMRYSAVGPILN